MDGSVILLLAIAVILILYGVYSLAPTWCIDLGKLLRGPSQESAGDIAVPTSTQTALSTTALGAQARPAVEARLPAAAPPTVRSGPTHAPLSLSTPFAFLIARERLALWVLFGAALLLRVLFLENVPNTVTADELDFSRDLMAIFTGHGTGFFGQDWTPEPAFSIYLMAGSWKLFGMTLFAERLVSAVLGAVAIIPFYALARRLVSIPAAVLATALFASARWYLHFSRSGWNNAHVVLYTLLAAWALTLALERGQRRYWGGFGVALALLLYGYFSGRTVIIAFAAYVLYVVWRRVRALEPGSWRPIVIGGVVAAVVCAVLFAPELPAIVGSGSTFNTRTSSVYIFNQPLGPGQSKFGVLADQAWRAIRSFVFMDGSYDGGTLGRYKPPGQGWLDPVGTLLYWGGLVLAARRARTLALWWLIFLIPLGITQLLTTGTPDGARGLVAIAPMYFFAALAIEWLLRRLSRYGGVVQGGALAVVLFVAAINVATYVEWVDSPASQTARQPAVPSEQFYTWRDFQLARLRANLGSMTAGEYDTLPPSAIAAQIFGLPTPVPTKPTP